VVRDWLAAGVPEVAVAVADEQTAGRGRQGRSWQAPPGGALLVSVGFRPADLLARYAWRLGAIVGQAMLDAGEETAGLRDRSLWLKWPNDIVALDSDGGLRKVAGVLGETMLGDDGGVASAVIGIGVDGDWAAADFPPELAAAMTSLRELAGGRPIDHEALLGAFLDRLEPRYEGLLRGHFDVGGWSSRQVCTGREVEVDVGGDVLRGRAAGVAPESGALRIETADGLSREVDAGEVVRCRVV
jgi:BirA family biotin operon repressor/biotin-[acetyl-CoA-carboxylase] ligase